MSWREDFNRSIRARVFADAEQPQAAPPSEGNTGGLDQGQRGRPVPRRNDPNKAINDFLRQRAGFGTRGDES